MPDSPHAMPSDAALLAFHAEGLLDRIIPVPDGYSGDHADQRSLLAGLARISGLDIRVQPDGGFQRVFVGDKSPYASPDRRLPTGQALVSLTTINHCLPASGRRFRTFLAPGPHIAALTDREQAAVERRGVVFDRPSQARSKEWLVQFVSNARSAGFFTDLRTPRPAKGGAGWDHAEPSLGKEAFGALTNEEVASKVGVWYSRNHRHWPDPLENGMGWQVLARDATRAWWFDAECIYEGEDAYVDALHAIARVSRGLLRVTDVTETWVKPTGRIHVDAMCNGKPIRFDLQVLDDWFDIRLLDQLNGMFPDTGPQFLLSKMDGQEFVVVMMAPSEYPVLGSLGLSVMAYPFAQVDAGKRRPVVALPGGRQI